MLVVLDDRGSLESWSRDPVVAPIVRDGAVALLSDRTGADAASVAAARNAAYATLGSGARATATDEGRALGDVVRAHGHVSIIGDGLDVFGPPRSSVPGSTPMLTIATRNHATDALITSWLAQPSLGPIVLVAATPSVADMRRHVWLGAVAEWGLGRGALHGSSTRRTGIVTLTDVAPSILRALDITPPSSMTGRAWEVRAQSGAPARLEAMRADLVRAATSRRPLTRAMVITAMIVFGAAAAALSRASTRLHAATAFAVAGACALPLAVFISPLYPTHAIVASIAWSFAVAIVAAALAVRLARERMIGFVGAITAVVILGDVLTGGWIAARSPLSFLIAGGDRFYGIGNELMGLVIGGLLAAWASWGERRIGWLAALCGVAVVVMSAPQAGAKFGAVLTAIPAFALAFVLQRRGRIDVRAAAGIAALTLGCAVVVVAIDRVGGASARSHLGSVTASSLPQVLARKVRAAGRLLIFSVWVQEVLIVGAALILVRWCAPWRWRAGASARMRAAGTAAIVGVLAAIAFNDAGAIAAALIALLAGGARLVASLQGSPAPAETGEDYTRNRRILR